MHHARHHVPSTTPDRHSRQTRLDAVGDIFWSSRPVSSRPVSSLLVSLLVGSSLLAACAGDDTSTSPGSAAPVTQSEQTTLLDSATSTAPSDVQPEGTVPADTGIDTVPTEVAVTQPPVTAPMATDPADTTPVDAVLDPLDDLNEDGSFDERCGTVDLGGGLVVETLCDTGLVPTPEGGVTPTAGLLQLPSPTRWDDLADVDATVRVATTVDGHRVVIYVLGSDTLFDSGSATLRTTSQPPLSAIVASIATRFPGAPVVVRGAADSVGEPAANQTLSEQRAAAVAAQLGVLGVDQTQVTSLGLGELVPVAEETNPDGTTSEIGRQVNRRVEIVVG